MRQTEMRKDREVFLDFIKTVAIYLVCFYHCHNYNGNFLADPCAGTYITFFVKGIACAGVPLFFMVNGALMLRRDFELKSHVRKIVSLVVLTFVWAVITLLVIGLIKGDHYTLSEFANAVWTWKNGVINHLWYLQALVCIYLLFPLIKAVYDQKDKKILRYFLIVVCIFTFGNVLLNMGANVAEFALGVNHFTGHSFNFFNNFNLFKGFYGYTVVYFILGAMLFDRLKTVECVPTKGMALLLGAGMVVLFLYGRMMSIANEGMYDTVWNGYDTVMALAICVAIFVLAYGFRVKLEHFSGVLAVIGQNTLGIYFVHRIVWAVVKPLFVRFELSTNIVVNLVFAVVMLLISLGIVLLLRRIPLVKRLFVISTK